MTSAVCHVTVRLPPALAGRRAAGCALIDAHLAISAAVLADDERALERALEDFATLAEILAKPRVESDTLLRLRALTDSFDIDFDGEETE